jgi:transcriptional regulator with XRE-family HTH domain
VKLNRKELKRWRKLKGLSQKDFYGKVGLGQDRGSRYERGENALPDEVEIALVFLHTVKGADIMLAESRAEMRQDLKAARKSRLQSAQTSA